MPAASSSGALRHRRCRSRPSRRSGRSAHGHVSTPTCGGSAAAARTPPSIYARRWSPPMRDDERSAAARAAAEQALASLLAASRPTSERLIVLGGLVPPTLARTDLSEIPAHLGTTDVDVLLVTHLTASENLGPIEVALDAMGFVPDTDGWRWRGRIEGRVVTIEFLCDLDDQPAEAIVKPPGCTRLHAVNLRGTGYVEHDHREYVIDGPDGEVRARIAGLAGYLCSK